ncbi:MAG TPA: VWA domain-containing protein [Gaiellaceae bacterium]
MAALALAAPAAGAVRITGLDTSGYPHVTLSVVTSTATRATPALTEDSVPVVGLEAVNLGRAKSVVLAVDNSRSMAGRSLADATAAAQAFVAQKRPDDRVAIVSFGHDAVALTGFSASTGDADPALRGLTVDRKSGTALYDAVVKAAAALQGNQLPGRVIILLTDGHDVSSSASLDQAIAAAKKAHASIYPIGIGSSDFDPSALLALARGTNGTYHSAASSSALEQVYASIGAELGRTWQLGYDTTARPGEQVELTATAGGEGSVKATVSVPASFADAPPAPASGLLPAGAYSPAGTVVLSLLVAAALVLAALILLRLKRGSWVKARVAPHLGERRPRHLRRRERLALLTTLFRATENAFGQLRQWRLIQKMLQRGDVPLRPAEFVWASVGCGLLLGFLFAVFGSSPVLILAAMGLGGAGPYVVVVIRVRRRCRAFENQLPDLLTTIAASLKAGHSFKHGLQAVVDENQPPASAELKRVLTEAGLGRPMDDALAEMADRIGSENFSFAITAVTIQRQVGGSLASLFDMVAETVRNRQQFARKIRSLTAMGRMSAYTLIAIPFFIAGTVTLINRDYMQPLYHTSTGHMLLLVGLAMMATGSVLLKKIVSFRG